MVTQRRTRELPFVARCRTLSPVSQAHSICIVDVCIVNVCVVSVVSVSSVDVRTVSVWGIVCTTCVRSGCYIKELTLGISYTIN
jgi:hypothetical protein